VIHDRVYEGVFTGLSVQVDGFLDAVDLYQRGYYGKAVLSRGISQQVLNYTRAKTKHSKKPHNNDSSNTSINTTVNTDTKMADANTTTDTVATTSSTIASVTVKGVEAERKSLEEKRCSDPLVLSLHEAFFLHSELGCGTLNISDLDGVGASVSCH
jgi:hypothetical protein